MKLIGEILEALVGDHNEGRGICVRDLTRCTMLLWKLSLNNCTVGGNRERWTLLAELWYRVVHAGGGGGDGACALGLAPMHELSAALSFLMAAQPTGNLPVYESVEWAQNSREDAQNATWDSIPRMGSQITFDAPMSPQEMEEERRQKIKDQEMATQRMKLKQQQRQSGEGPGLIAQLNERVWSYLHSRSEHSQQEKHRAAVTAERVRRGELPDLSPIALDAIAAATGSVATAPGDAHDAAAAAAKMSRDWEAEFQRRLQFLEQCAAIDSDSIDERQALVTASAASAAVHDGADYALPKQHPSTAAIVAALPGLLQSVQPSTHFITARDFGLPSQQQKKNSSSGHRASDAVSINGRVTLPVLRAMTMLVRGENDSACTLLEALHQLGDLDGMGGDALSRWALNTTYDEA